jgi:hypothetical protein
MREGNLGFIEMRRWGYGVSVYEEEGESMEFGLVN